MPTKYKVWLHLEEIFTNDEGEESYQNADELVLPLPVMLTESIEEAEAFMNTLHQAYYTSKLKVD